MTLTLIPDEDPRLHTKTKIFNFRLHPQLDEAFDEMFDLMRKHNGIGLAAPQVGLEFRFFIMNLDDKEYVCINPYITKRSKETELRDEGCLSYPGDKVFVERAKEIRVLYTDRRGMPKQKKFTGLAARCFQHELDHLNGITFRDVGTLVDA